MKTITYHKTSGQVFPDGVTEDMARRFLTGPSLEITVSSELFVIACRALGAEGILPLDQIEFIYDDMKLPLMRGGSLEHWPRGFCDTSQDILLRLLEARFKK